jgi:hypothetical protein
VIDRRLDIMRRPAALIILAALIGGTIAVAMLAGGKGRDSKRGSASALSGSATEAVDARFAVLSRADTNRCDLSAAELRGMPDGMRLQGSCCFPMDRAGYEEQLGDLRGYDHRLVPRDPYDVHVSLAKRLLGYRDIALTPREQAAYERATEISKLGGPCCCACWRWEAFKGQARFLLARRDYTAEQVARLWDSEDGCGGSREHA